MTADAISSMFVMPAIVFGVMYFPIVKKLSRGLLSPYAKADVTKRVYAASIDSAVVAALGVSSWLSGNLLYVAVAAAYVLCRDAIKGQSIGKFLVGLVVISLETGRPSSLAGSVRRNGLFLLPGANLVAVVLEARTVNEDPQGQRLGDRLAQTQVVEGFGAKDLVKSLQNWLLSGIAELGREVGREERARRRIDRAA